MHCEREFLSGNVTQLEGIEERNIPSALITADVSLERGVLYVNWCAEVNMSHHARNRDSISRGHAVDSGADGFRSRRDIQGNLALRSPR